MASVSPLAVAGTVCRFAVTYPVTSILVTSGSTYVVRRLICKESIEKDLPPFLVSTAGLLASVALMRSSSNICSFASRHFWTQSSWVGRVVVCIPALLVGLVGRNGLKAGLVASLVSTIALFAVAIVGLEEQSHSGAT